MQKKRYVFVTILLNLALPSLGYVYLGRLLRGIIAFNILIAAIVLPNALKFYSHFYGLIASYAVVLFFVIGIHVDSIVCTLKEKKYTLMRYNRWYIYIAFFLFGIVYFALIVGISNRFIKRCHLYRVPTSSMMPTLNVGDHFVGEKYRFNENPARGDVVTFLYREGENVKRCVAVGGDHLLLKKTKVYINGVLQNENYLMPEQPNQMKIDEPVLELDVPSGKYFLLGDNRANSADSRTYGFIDRSDITGKVIYTFYSKKNGFGEEPVK